MRNNKRQSQFQKIHKKILELGPLIIREVTKVINEELKEKGALDNYKVVWNQLENFAIPVIKKILEENFRGCKITPAESKSTYPDIKMEFRGFKFAIDIKSNESSKEPWYDIARLDTIIETRINKYDEEYELVIKYDSKTGKLIEMFFETLRDTVGFNPKCKGVKFRPYDGKLRPKSWSDFSNRKSYWKTKEEFLKGIENSKKYRWKELLKKHVKGLNQKEKEELRKILE